MQCKVGFLTWLAGIELVAALHLQYAGGLSVFRSVLSSTVSLQNVAHGYLLYFSGYLLYFNFCN